MNAKVIAVMSSQWGLVTRRQALERGMSADHVDRLVRTRRWVSVRPGVYAEREYVDSLTGMRDRRLLADRAASLRIGSGHVWSHHSAGFALDLPLLHEPTPTTHVTRIGIVGSHDRHGVKHHRAPYSPDQVVRVEGLHVLGPARTAADIAREHGYLHGLVAADSALRAGATRAQCVAVRAGMTSWPHATVVDDVFASASPDTDSAGETLMRHLVTSLGFGVPEVQFGLTADGRTAWCDLRLGRHLFEFDGHHKYLRVADGGLAVVDPEAVLWEEKKRQDWLCGFKLGMSRVVWDDCLPRSWERTRARLEREYRDTCARFGTDITDLASFRPRGSRPRPERPAQAAFPRWAA